MTVDDLLAVRCEETFAWQARPISFMAWVLSHVTFMPVLIRPANFLGQVIGNASEGKYNTVTNTTSVEVTFQNCLNLGITPFSSENSN